MTAKVLPHVFRRAFVGDYVREEAVLKDVTEQEWRVGVEVDGDEVRFCQGWRRFVIAHGLNRRDTLLFRFKNDMQFDVHVLCRCYAEIMDFEYVHEYEACPNCEMQRKPLFPDHPLTDFYGYRTENRHFRKELPPSTVEKGGLLVNLVKC